MSAYTSQEEKVILKDNDEIISIDLNNNPNLKVLIIDNLPNLEKIDFFINEGLYVSISNCEKLTNIITLYGLLFHNVYGSYFYLGENLKSLERINIYHFNTIKIADEVFDKLKDLTMTHIKSLICNFKNFPKLNTLALAYVEISDLIVDSGRISLFSLSHCSFENIEITGKGHINSFEFYNNEYKSLKTENPIKSSYLILYNDNKVVPYIPLSDEIDDDLKFFINMDNLYDSKYKYFIERNLSKVKIYNRRHNKITLDDIKFNVPQKKRAR